MPTTAKKTEEATIEDQLQQLRDDIGALSKTLGDLTTSQVRGAEFAAKRKVVELGHKGEAAIEATRDTLTEAGDEAVRRVRAKPLQAMAIAAAAGLAVGLLTRSR
ncbi:DUF883 family protein [Rhodobacteraceae bacterium NNCM2]|nr:DUF883 family protein [Coraliihabitans acroporae]